MRRDISKCLSPVLGGAEPKVAELRQFGAALLERRGQRRQRLFGARGGGGGGGGTGRSAV